MLKSHFHTVSNSNVNPQFVSLAKMNRLIKLADYVMLCILFLNPLLYTEHNCPSLKFNAKTRNISTFEKKQCNLNEQI